MTIDELQVLITANTQDLRNEMKKAQNDIKGLQKTADKTQSSVLSSFSKLKNGIIALGIGKVIKDSIMSGINAIESDSLFETSLDNMADSVRAWSDEVSEALGLDAVAVRKNTGIMYNMTTSMGLAEDNALKLSKGISVLTEDMASFYNLSTEEAFNKLRAGITGETEPLKALGILVDDNTIKQVAYQQGIAKTGAELTQQQKVLARYVAILMQTGNAQGDLARTMTSPANQLRLLKNQVVQLGRAFSSFLMPVLSAVLPYLIAFTKVITGALNGLAKFLGLSSGGSGLGGMSTNLGDMSTSLGDAGNSISKASKGLGGVNSGLKDANKNAKKLKGQLAGFDEMTVLTEKTSDTDSSGATSGSGLGANLGAGTLGAIGGLGADGSFNLGDYVIGESEAGNKIDQLADKIKNAFLDFASGINFDNLVNAFNNLYDSVKPITQTLWDGLKWAWDEILKPLAQWTIGDLIPAFMNALAGALDFLNPILSDCMTALQWLWESFLQPIATFTGGVIVDVLNGIGDALSWISQNEVVMTILQALAITLGILATPILLIIGALVTWSAIGTVVTAVTTAFGVAMNFLTSPITLVVVGITALIAGIILLVKHWDDVKEVAKKVWDKVKEIWGKVSDWFSEKVIEPVKEAFDSLGEALGKVWDSITEAFTNIGETAKNVWDNIKKAWSEAGNWFNTKIISPVKNFFSGMWNGLINGGKNAWTGIKSVFSSIPTWFKTQFTKAWTNVKNVFSTGGKIFDGIKEGIAETFKTVVNGLIGGINKVIAVPFNAINKLLNKIRNISVAGVEPFKDLIKKNALSVPEIPLLARGGVVDSPTLAMVGEAGKEAVVPLERNTGWIDKLAEKINANGNGGQPQHITIKLGEETIFDKFIDYTNSKSFETNGEVFSL